MRIAGSLIAILALPTFAQAQSISPRAAPAMHPSNRPAPIARPHAVARVVGRPPVSGEPMRMPNTGLASPPLHVERAVARHVRFHGGLLAVPVVVAIGVPVFLDVPGLGDVSVPEEDYPEIYDLLTSDDPADQEKAFSLLQRDRKAPPAVSAEAESASQGASPPKFRIVYPPASTSSAAPDDNVRDLAAPLSSDDQAPGR